MPGRAGLLPTLIYKGSSKEENYTNEFIEAILEHTPLLKQKYIPPAVWGTNGHIQTAMFSLLEKRPCLEQIPVSQKRQQCRLEDGSTVSYDLFTRTLGEQEVSGLDVILAVCPGFANSSESIYIKGFATLAVSQGYRVVVLNHLGVLDDERLTSPRIFSFGSTEEYGAMIKSVRSSYPTSHMVAVGFSLGANIICKYLGENSSNQKEFIGCISLCHGYDFISIKTKMATWQKMRKFYAKQLSIKLKSVMVKHFHTLIGHWQQENPQSATSLRENPEWQTDSHDKSLQSSSTATAHCSPLKANDPQPQSERGTSLQSVSRKDLQKCEYMPQLDELITIKMTGHTSVEEYYRWASCSNYMDNIEIPALYVNAHDDPLFSKTLLQYPEKRAKSHSKTLLVVTAHGGHLGYFTKTGSSKIDTFTWLERAVLEYINSLLIVRRANTSDDGTIPEVHACGKPDKARGMSEKASVESNNNINGEAEMTTPNNDCNQTPKAGSTQQQIADSDVLPMPHNWSSSLLYEAEIATPNGTENDPELKVKRSATYANFRCETTV